MKDVAPSSGLRKWFGHDPARWREFWERYRTELGEKQALADELRRMAGEGTLTLLYAARDEERNNAVALKAYLGEGKG